MKEKKKEKSTDLFDSKEWKAVQKLVQKQGKGLIAFCAEDPSNDSVSRDYFGNDFSVSKIECTKSLKLTAYTHLMMELDNPAKYIGQLSMIKTFEDAGVDVDEILERND